VFYDPENGIHVRKAVLGRGLSSLLYLKWDLVGNSLHICENVKIWEFFFSMI
jgi:hypothetical protein